MLFILAQTAHATVLSRSASSSTMKASLPPSSIVDFLRFRPALRGNAFRGIHAAGQRHALDSWIVDHAVHLVVRDQQVRISAGGRTRLKPQFFESDGALRHAPACFTITTLPAIKLGAAKRASW